MKWLSLALVLFVGCQAPADPANEPTPIDSDAPWSWHAVATGLERPVGLVAHPNGTLLVIEQEGFVKELDGTIWLDLSDKTRASGEQGLLGLAFGGGFVFASYTDLGGDSIVSKMPLTAGEPGQENVILTVRQPFSNHNGGHIVYFKEHLYIALGDGGLADDPEGNGQNKLTLLGSILRIDPAGEGYQVPDDNPFVNDPLGADEVYHYGLRNPWRFSFDSAGGLWIGDVGQNQWEEVDYAAPGAAGLNYGWNAYEGSHQYRGLALEHVLPVTEYANEGSQCSVTGGHVDTSANTSLNGLYLFGDFCSGNVWSYNPITEETNLQFETGWQISSFAHIQDETYVVSYSGTIYRFQQEQNL